jgi:hypothetical protein
MYKSREYIGWYFEWYVHIFEWIFGIFPVHMCVAQL